MRVAIYARKSNDDNDQSSENKSVTRQIDQARAYAEAKGWRVLDDHVFTDDGISGAEFRERPGLLKLLAHLDEPDVVVMSEISRLGRDMIQNSVILDKIINEHGVKVHYYLTAKRKRWTPLKPA